MFFGHDVKPTVINLTPHDIVIDVNGEKTTYRRCGDIARVEMTVVEQPELFATKIPVVFNTTGKVVGLPDQIKHATFYLVSKMVADACPERPDVLYPDTGSTAIRNEKGQIEAVTRLGSARLNYRRCECCHQEDYITLDGICQSCASGMVE
jgi:hypothetical protein